MNSPYSEPVYHHLLDDCGQPLEQPAILGRRTSKFIVPVPRSRKASAAAQASLDLETYTLNSLINEIRGYVNTWRQIRNQADWGVTPASARLLDYWRNHQFSSVRPFFCQVEAVETIIWLTEVAPKRAATKGLLDQIQKANDEANPALFRLAMKMATGSGKTTVMAMLIAWQTVNAVRRDSKLFSRAFLIVAPGITIKDRLRVLMPSAPDNYYEDRELVPPEMLNEVKRAEIVITNYHAFQHRETGPSGKVAKGLLQGNDPEPIRTTESDGEMLRRACGDLLNHKNVNVFNDEAHHCYRHKTGGEEEKLTGDDKKEAEANEEAARLWINGIEALKRKVGVRDNGFVERVGDAGFKCRIEEGRLHHLVRRRAVPVNRRFELHSAIGQRAGLVGAEHIHGAKVFDGIQPPHNNAVCGKMTGTGGQRDADDRRKHFWREADRQSLGKQQRFNDRTAHQLIDRQHGQHDDDHYPQEHGAELANASGELGFFVCRADLPGNRSELGLSASLDDQHGRCPAAQR